MGDGTSISVWTDKWIPGNLSMMPSVHIGSNELSRVSELIVNGSWDIQKIQSNFTKPDADAILNIPIRLAGVRIPWLGLQRNRVLIL